MFVVLIVLLFVEEVVAGIKKEDIDEAKNERLWPGILMYKISTSFTPEQVTKICKDVGESFNQYTKTGKLGASIDHNQGHVIDDNEPLKDIYNDITYDPVTKTDIIVSQWIQSLSRGGKMGWHFDTFYNETFTRWLHTLFQNPNVLKCLLFGLCVKVNNTFMRIHDITVEVPCPHNTFIVLDRISSGDKSFFIGGNEFKWKHCVQSGHGAVTIAHQSKFHIDQVEKLLNGHSKFTKWDFEEVTRRNSAFVPMIDEHLHKTEDDWDYLLKSENLLKLKNVNEDLFLEELYKNQLGILSGFSRASCKPFYNRDDIEEVLKVFVAVKNSLGLGDAGSDLTIRGKLTELFDNYFMLNSTLFVKYREFKLRCSDAKSWKSVNEVVCKFKETLARVYETSFLVWDPKKLGGDVTEDYEFGSESLRRLEKPLWNLSKYLGRARGIMSCEESLAYNQELAHYLVMIEEKIQVGSMNDDDRVNGTIKEICDNFVFKFSLGNGDKSPKEMSVILTREYKRFFGNGAMKFPSKEYGLEEHFVPKKRNRVNSKLEWVPCAKLPPGWQIKVERQRRYKYRHPDGRVFTSLKAAKNS